MALGSTMPPGAQTERFPLGFDSPDGHEGTERPARYERCYLMATRQTAAQKAAEAAQAVTPVAPDSLPAAWGDEPIEEFNGHNLTDKADLIGVPFLIIGAEIERTEGKDYDVAYVYALDANGTEFEFSDTSSTGVRFQIQTMLAEKDLPPHAGAGFQKLRTVIRQGLRSSEFSVTDEETGKKRKAVSYYLSAAGRKVG